MVDINKYQGISRTLLGLSCFLLTSCALTESTYESKLAETAPSGYGQLVNKSSSLVSLRDRREEEAQNGSRVICVDGDITCQVTAEGTMSTISDSNGDLARLDLSLQHRFYQTFGDAKLNALVERALAHNYDINTAYLNLKQAEIELGLARANMHPTVNASINSGVRKELNHGTDTTENSGGSLAISYELDLFGRLDASQRSSLESFKATAYDYRAMRLAIIQRTCEYYWNYAFAREALTLAEEQLKASEKRLELIRVKRESGAADGLEYDQALVNHRNVEQTVYQRGYELTAAHNALTTLLGEYSDAPLEQAVTDMALEVTRSPEIKVALPADLLQNRPDMMAYEARVRAAYAGVDMADASFYPGFNLNAAVNTGSADSLVRFLTDPVGTLGAAITLPFFNYNELSLQKESALIARDKARLDFANGFISAVEEVSNALNALSYQEQLQRSTFEEYELTRKNLSRYEERYRIGAAELSDVLDASDSLRSAQNKLLSSKRDLLNASMSLMIALGGELPDLATARTPVQATAEPASEAQEHGVKVSAPVPATNQASAISAAKA